MDYHWTVDTVVDRVCVISENQAVTFDYFSSDRFRARNLVNDHDFFLLYLSSSPLISIALYRSANLTSEHAISLSARLCTQHN